jgi:hypothetical protein
VISESDEGLGYPVLRSERAKLLKERMLGRGHGKLEWFLRKDVGRDGVPNQIFDVPIAEKREHLGDVFGPWSDVSWGEGIERLEARELRAQPLDS